jgi:hypothetical protein
MERLPRRLEAERRPSWQGREAVLPRLVPLLRSDYTRASVRNQITRTLCPRDWPRIPIPKGRAQFEEIIKLGDKVSCLLNPLGDAGSILKASLGKNAKKSELCNVLVAGVSANPTSSSNTPITAALPANGISARLKEMEAQRPEWGEVTGDLYLNDSIYLSNVPEEIWRYELGGYPVLKKWLGYRQSNRRGDSPLTLKELDELRGIVHRIAALLTLRPQLAVQRKLMRHTDIRTTMNVYGDVITNQESEALAKIARLALANSTQTARAPNQ